MERGFYNDDFEQLIRQKADQYKMFPSDGVWKGIHRSLHTRRKWYGLGLVFFLAGISYIASLQLMAPANSKKIQADPPVTNPPDKSGTNSNNNISGPIAAATDLSGNSNSSSSFSVFTAKTFRGSNNNEKTDNTVHNQDSDQPHTIVITELREQIITDELSTDKPQKAASKISSPASGFPVLITGPEKDPVSALATIVDLSAVENQNRDLARASAPPSESVNSGREEDQKRINWLQEYAVYEITPPPVRRWSWQLAFAPTMNYRRLTSNNNIYNQLNIKGLPAGALEGKPETLVSHQPALGFGLGSFMVYSVSKNLKVTGGLQLNYSRYAIKAYATPVPEPAKITLDAAGRPDSLVSLTRLRNFGGEKAEDIQNQYFQISAPIGLELSLLGNEKLSLNIAGNLQPTYLLNANSYLITTDFKNYMRAPSLVRRWNVNAGAEIFLNYKAGNLQWQVGPQFRYQLLSSYVSEYPIREYLMEYGVKIGVTKTLR